MENRQVRKVDTMSNAVSDVILIRTAIGPLNAISSVASSPEKSTRRYAQPRPSAEGILGSEHRSTKCTLFQRGSLGARCAPFLRGKLKGSDHVFSRVAPLAILTGGVVRELRTTG